MSEQQPPVTETPPKVVSPHQSKGFGPMSLMLACVVTAMVSIGTSMWLMRDEGGSNRQHIVFVDAKRLIDAKAMELAAKKLSDSDSAVEGAKFAAALQGVVAEYQSKGLTVVNGAALLSESDDNDLTTDVAKRLSVQLDPKLLGDAIGAK